MVKRPVAYWHSSFCILHSSFPLSSECAGTHATLRRSRTRFDSWRGHFGKTLEPDGQATGCNPVEVGSTPTGVS